MLDTTMRLLMRKNSVYIAFIFTGAIIGERVRRACSLSSSHVEPFSQLDLGS
jgi:hypothetical protein